ncbi:MAG TPA: epoxyqueuosine reductase QueH [Candidatus Faecisoma merdavium]|nr:epoxyqueuosine reductase QueH [Candidatus Faecisoma merdavium]
MNYQLELEKIINNLECKKTLLLHSCCAPCSSYVITYLKDYFDITILYYNPNIEPIEEYNKRKEEQIRLCKLFNIKVLDCDYDNDLFHETVLGLEKCKEGGSRCFKCYELRLRKTASLASNYDFFGTTLTVSPFKNSNKLNEIGLSLEKEYNVKYLVSDFKKKEGYKKSIILSKEYNLYRQDFCGCIYSKRDKIID